MFDAEISIHEIGICAFDLSCLLGECPARQSEMLKVYLYLILDHAKCW